MRVKLADGRTATGSDREVVPAPVRRMTASERLDVAHAAILDDIRAIDAGHVPHEGAPRRLIGRVQDTPQ